MGDESRRRSKSKHSTYSVRRSCLKFDRGARSSVDASRATFWTLGAANESGCHLSIILRGSYFPSPPFFNSRSSCDNVLTTRAGFPTATLQSGTSRVTTLPAPIVHPLPIVTPA